MLTSPARIWAGRARPPVTASPPVIYTNAGRPWAHLRIRYRQSDRRIHGGWDVAGITTAQTGQSETSTASSDLSNTGSFSYRFDQLANPKTSPTTRPDQGILRLHSRQRNILCWYNPAASPLHHWPRGQQSAHAFGDARIGNLRGPDLRDFDFVLQKHFQLGEFGQIEVPLLRILHIFNHPNLGLPGNYVDVPAARRSPIRRR